MKLLAFLLMLVISWPTASIDYPDRSKPVLYFLNQSPTAAYYGNAVSSYIAHYTKKYRVYAFYMKMDFGETDFRKRYFQDQVIADIRRVNPEVIVIHGGGHADLIRKTFPKIKLIVFSLEKSGINIHTADPIEKLLHITKSMNYEFKKVYILTDNSTKGIRFGRLYEALLQKHGITEKQIEVIKVSTTVELEKALRRLNREEPGLLLNCMYEITDSESTKHRFVMDIKQMIVRVNRTHLDVGGYRAPYGNEALLLSLDYSRIGDFIEQVETGVAKQLPPIGIKAYFNLRRMNGLGLNQNYMRAVNEIDEIVYESR